MERSIQLSTALVLAGGLLFAGVSIGVLLKF